MSSGRIGVGVITYNRVPLFIQCVKSIPAVDRLIVVNDGNPYEETIYPSTVTKVIQHRKNRGVGISKNDALRYLMNEGCEHIFLCEDDIRIKNEKIFKHNSIRSGNHYLLLWMC